SGMLGTALLARPWPGVTWTAIDIQPPSMQTPPTAARTVTADIRDEDAMVKAFQGADVVIHAAAALPSHRAAQIRSVDVDGTKSVVAAARRADVQRLVHISSTAVYGLPRLCPTPEHFPGVPVDAYSEAKLAAEQAVLRGGRDQGLCTPILRPK